ncbi:DUF5667 domain-containing protein [Stackebrandtia soli]|uniref:DUF5667 domain-containing protein n=1 Tax=Stackebrandtia soli TaxID=1892856 RepID=UPI0039EB4E98
MRDLIGNPLDKRRAERFNELLTEAETGRRRHTKTTHDEDLRPLVDIGQALSTASRQSTDASAPRPEFAAELRQRLMAVAAVGGLGSESDAPPRADPVPSRPRARRRFIIAGALAAAVFGLTGVSTASGDALPGEALYPVKRSTEHAQLALAGSDVNRGQLYFEFARTRLFEAEQVIKDPAAVTIAFNDMDDDIRWGMQELTSAAVDRADPAVLDIIDDFLDSHRADVAALADRLPVEARPEAAESIDLSTPPSSASNSSASPCPAPRTRRNCAPTSSARSPASARRSPPLVATARSPPATRRRTARPTTRRRRRARAIRPRRQARPPRRHPPRPKTRRTTEAAAYCPNWAICCRGSSDEPTGARRRVDGRD